MNWKYSYTVLLLCMFAFFVTMAARLVASPLVPFITDDFDISNTLIGGTFTGMWVAYASTQYPGGVLGDGYGERRVIQFSLAGIALGSALLALSPYFFLFVLFAVTIGAFAGLQFSAGTALLDRLFDETGAAIGIYSFGAPLAGLLTPITAAWIALRFGWRPAVAAVGLLSVGVLALFAGTVRSTRPPRPDLSVRSRFRPRTVIELYSRPSIAFSAVIAVVGTFTWQGTATFMPMFLIELHGRTPTFAATVFSVYFVLHGVVQVGIGFVSDRYGTDLAIGLCMGAGIVGYPLLILKPGLVWLGVAVLLIGTAMSFNAAVLPRIIEQLSPDETGTGVGLVRSSYGIVSATGPVVVGFVADTWGWAVSFGMLPVLLAIVLVMLVLNWGFGIDY